MESRRTNCSFLQGPQLVLQCIAAILVLFFCAVTGNGKFDVIFVIGDSSVDIGNRDPNNSTYTAVDRVNQDWTPPLGRTNPGVPAGRYSDGKVISDYVADYIGLKPRPYHVLSVPSTTTNASQGTNFTVGGTGVFYNLGFTKIGDQIKQLQAVLNSGVYNANVYDKSVIHCGMTGNDYTAYLRNGGSIHTVAFLVRQVVNQIATNLHALYALGFRNFVVGKLPPLGCLPSSTYSLGYLCCSEPSDVLASIHNADLHLKLRKSFPNYANILFLDTYLA